LSEAKKQTVLVVDDDTRDREALRDELVKEGYRVVEALTGDDALARFAEIDPDLILLNIMMPGTNGIEVCRRLSSDPETAHIPVLFVTSQRRREVRLEGIAAGALDFILKPVDIADLRIRVRNAAQMKALYDESEERFLRISDLETHRDALVHMIIHDLRGPLTSIRGNLDLLKMTMGDEAGSDLEESLKSCIKGADSMNGMIRSILDVSKLESKTLELDLEELELRSLVESARDSLGPVAFKVEIEGLSSQPVRLRCDSELVSRVLVNLLSNALDHSPEEASVVVEVSGDADSARVAVRDRGPGIPAEFQEQIFEKFAQVSGNQKRRKASVGLGLAFCKLAVEAHGGRIGVESADGAGSEFWFQLPVNPEAT
jgi:signal transduction histidine kinase